MKSKKKDTKRAKARETDEFDGILAMYKTKLLKRINKSVPSAKAPAFEEIEMSDDWLWMTTPN